MSPVRSMTATLALVAMAVVAPSFASAHPGPGDVVTSRPAPQVNTDLVDRLGPKYILLTRHSTERVPSPSPRSDTMNWTAAGSGIGGAALVLAGIAWLLVRRRHRDVRPETGDAVRA